MNNICYMTMCSSRFWYGTPVAHMAPFEARLKFRHLDEWSNLQGGRVPPATLVQKKN